jgi:hypothetical protein
MSTASLSADPAKLRHLAKNIASQWNFSSVWLFHLYSFFICMTFSFVWLFHLYDFFICMTFSSVWLFHLYDFFICMTFSSVWLFHLYEFFICMSFSSVWILRIGFAYEFWSVSFSFLRSMSTKYVCEVCRRSIFWWDEHYTNILLQCEASLHHYITSSHVFFKFHVFLIFISLLSFFNKKTNFLKRTNFS